MEMLVNTTYKQQCAIDLDDNIQTETNTVSMILIPKPILETELIGTGWLGSWQEQPL